jgi:uncharacterized repeat protein (TIGR01451 family)
MVYLQRLGAGVALLLISAPASAQVLSTDYTFAVTSGNPYTPLTGATLQIPGSDDNTNGTYNDALVVGPLNLGFDFCFDRVPYTQFGVNPHGIATLGATTTNSFTNDLDNAALYPVIAAWWDHQNLYDNGGAGSGCNFSPPIGVFTQLSGSAPNRVLAIEWNTQIVDNTDEPWWAGCGLTMNRYQMRLFEGSDRIEYAYGSMWANSGQPVSGSIGIAAAIADFVSVTPAGASATTSSAVANDTIAQHVTPTNPGIVYSFTPTKSATTSGGSASPPSPFSGQAVDLVAQVTGSSSAGGQVLFREGVTDLGSAVVNGSGQATLSGQVFTAGTHSLTVLFLGDCFDLPSSGAFSLDVAPAADLAITKTDGTASATPGGATTYTLVASNLGPDPVNPANVTDNFPAACSVTYSSVAAGGATGNTLAGSGNINDAALSLPVGGSVTYTATCTIASSATGPLVNTATVASAQADPSSANNSATDTDTLTPSADLSLAKVLTTGGAIPPGGPAAFTLTVTNLGPSDDTGVTVIDNLPAGLTYAGNDCGATFAAPTLTWNVGALAAGAAAVCHLSVTVPQPGTFVNTASVSGAISDPVVGNGSGQATVTAVPSTIEVPTLDGRGVALLLLALAMAGVALLRRQS